MRALIMAAVIFAACNPPGPKDERVNAGSLNPAQGTSTADAQSQGTSTNTGGGTTTENAPNPNGALAVFLPTAYTQDLEPSVKRLCTDTCHTGAPAAGTPLLNTADDLKAAAIAAAAAIDAGRMPKDLPTLTTEDKKYLAQLSVSLKNWGKNGTFPLDISEYAVTYKAISTVASGLCLSCHKGETPPGGVSLDTIEAWKSNMPRILRAIESGAMPPKIDEVQGPRLINFLKEWQAKNYPP